MNIREMQAEGMRKTRRDLRICTALLVTALAVVAVAVASVAATLAA